MRGAVLQGYRVPSFTGNTLAPSLPQSGMGFPNIPNPSTTLPVTRFVAYNGILHTGDLWNFGPLFDDGILTILPPQLLGTPYKIFVPKTDADGNDIAGIRSPDVSVPVATYTGWALRAGNAADPVPIVDGCDASGQKIPFYGTRAERLAAGDPRLSLQERYKDHTTYVSLVTTAAQSLEQQRLLLDQDVQNYISGAEAAPVP